MYSLIAATTTIKSGKGPYNVCDVRPTKTSSKPDLTPSASGTFSCHQDSRTPLSLVSSTLLTKVSF